MRPALFAIAVAAMMVSFAAADDPVEDADALEEPVEVATPIADIVPSGEAQPVFFEGFQGDSHAFFLSKHKDYSGTNAEVGVHSIAGGPAGDKHMILRDGIAEAGHPLKYGLVALFDEAVSTAEGATDSDKPIVIQYEHRAQNGVTCDGGYAKLLLADPDAGEDSELAEITRASVTAEDSEVDLSKPEYYGIMFGPDRCGLTNKVHFILRHRSPVSGKWSEHHLKTPPLTADGTDTALYTLVIRPADNTFDLLVNGESKRSGSLLEEMEPPINPPAMIPDVEDTKPDDWVDEAKIPDPEAVKPDDWDDDAPPTIPNTDIEKPDGWLDDEPDKVPDPDAVKPEDWDDEEDGDWEAPLVANSRCEEAPGCGEWQRPFKANPEYKGKWAAPLIDNPEYKGEWAPRQIDNPDYFVDEHPGRIPSLKGIMFELMVNTGGIAFDNILISRDEAGSKAFAAETWAVEHGAQVDKVKNEARAKARAERAKLLKEGGAMNMALFALGEATEFVEDYLVPVVVVATAVMVGLMFWCCSGDGEDSVDLSEFEEQEEEAEGGAVAGGGTYGPVDTDGAEEAEEDEADVADEEDEADVADEEDEADVADEEDEADGADEEEEAEDEAGAGVGGDSDGDADPESSLRKRG